MEDKTLSDEIDVEDARAHRLVHSCAPIFDWPLLANMAEHARNPSFVENHIMKLGWGNGTIKSVRDAVRLRIAQPKLWTQLTAAAELPPLSTHVSFERSEGPLGNFFSPEQWSWCTSFTMLDVSVSRTNIPLLLKDFEIQDGMERRSTFPNALPAVEDPYTSKDVLDEVYGFLQTTSESPEDCGLILKPSGYSLTLPRFVLGGRYIIQDHGIPSLCKVVDLVERRSIKDGRASIRVLFDAEHGPFEGRPRNFWDRRIVGRLNFSFTQEDDDGVGARTTIPFLIEELKEGYFILLSPGWDGNLTKVSIPGMRSGAYLDHIAPFAKRSIKIVAECQKFAESVITAMWQKSLPLEILLGERLLTPDCPRLVELTTKN